MPKKLPSDKLFFAVSVSQDPGENQFGLFLTHYVILLRYFLTYNKRVALFSTENVQQNERLESLGLPLYIVFHFIKIILTFNHLKSSAM